MKFKLFSELVVASQSHLSTLPFCHLNSQHLHLLCCLDMPQRHMCSPPGMLPHAQMCSLYLEHPYPPPLLGLIEDPRVELSKVWYPFDLFYLPFLFPSSSFSAQQLVGIVHSIDLVLSVTPILSHSSGSLFPTGKWPNS